LTGYKCLFDETLSDSSDIPPFERQQKTNGQVKNIQSQRGMRNGLVEWWIGKAADW